MKKEKLSVVSDQSSVGDAGKKAEDYFFRASAEDFKKIPGSPIVYWMSHQAFDAFTYDSVEDHFVAKKGMAIGDNARFLRYWVEISKFDVNFTAIGPEDTSIKKWYPCLHGGSFRKWSSNKEYVVNWINDGIEPKSAITKKTSGHWSRYIISTKYFFSPGINWSAITSSSYSARYHSHGYAFTSASMAAFAKDSDPKLLLLLVNSVVGKYYFLTLSPTLNYGIAELKKIPYKHTDEKEKLLIIVDKLITFSSKDWNSFETSWDLTTLPLLKPDYRQSNIEATYQQLRTHWQQTTLEMQHLEEENNRIFIEAYGLQDELTPDVPLNEITLTCNPYYRYKKKAVSEQSSAISEKNGGEAATESFPLDPELEAKLLSDTMKEFLSYAVGCMFGRYSLDAPGLILANQGETLEDYFRIVNEKQAHPEVVSNQSSVISEKHGNYAATDNCTLKTDNFLPDADNVIPILDQDWFIDDITSRFHEFLKTTFGDEHYDENLKFITDAIGKDIRKYVLKDFYKDHLKTYKKRPIYWLFSSPKGSFNALIYMHRYRPDTVSVILNDYLREFRTKLQNAQENLEQLSISADATKTEKTNALKQIEKLKKTITELDTYENEILYPLATQNIEIDLDDGVKVNYKKFGKALKKVLGLS